MYGILFFVFFTLFYSASQSVSVCSDFVMTNLVPRVYSAFKITAGRGEDPGLQQGAKKEGAFLFSALF